jgi:hypothetical protein
MAVAINEVYRIEARLIDVPCGCYECSKEVQDGHEATCQASPKWLLLAERKGMAYRRFDRAKRRWNWYDCSL